jgi:hypothetical protein
MPSRRFPLGAALLAGIVLSRTAWTSERPGVSASSGSSISPSEARALTEWALARPDVRRSLGSDRFRLVRAGVEGSATPEHAALLFVRDLQTGAARALRVDRASGKVVVRDVPGLLQPGEEEIEEARAIIERDPALSSYSSDASLSLLGGFHVRPPAALRDPCSVHVCVEFGFMRADFSKGPARRVIVDLSRGAVAHHDYRGSRMTETDGTR